MSLSVDVLMLQIDESPDCRVIVDSYKELSRAVGGDAKAYSLLSRESQGRVREARIAVRHTSASQAGTMDWSLHDRGKKKASQ